MPKPTLREILEELMLDVLEQASKEAGKDIYISTFPEEKTIEAIKQHYLGLFGWDERGDLRGIFLELLTNLQDKPSNPDVWKLHIDLACDKVDNLVAKSIESEE